MSESRLRQVPKMDVLLAHPLFAREGAGLPHALLRTCGRAVLEELRRDLLAHPDAPLPTDEDLARRTVEQANIYCRNHLKRVINATGVVLHTNLGRAPLAEQAALAAYEAARGYSNLEYDLSDGGRGSRHAHTDEILCQLTGAEAALVVNNNAAAVFLMLSAITGGKSVAVSRGELVEIGGGFRVPDIMSRSGCTLMEVGTTNKTRLADYEKAVAQGAGGLLKVHTSNYQIVGFTQETSLEALAALSRREGVPLLYDLGSGALGQAFLPTLPHCPTVTDALAAGVDVVCFSGDKLLGGPQSGIVLGKQRFIDAMKSDPMARAFRMDKLSLAALEATLRLCLDRDEAVAHIPTLAMLGADAASLRERAIALAAGLCAQYEPQVLPVCGQVGGGAMPNTPLPSFAVALTPPTGDADGLATLLREHSVPIVGRVHKGQVLLDVRTLTAEDITEIRVALRSGG